MEPIINQKPDATDDSINESTSSSSQKQATSILPNPPPPPDIATSVAASMVTSTSKRTSNEGDDDTQQNSNIMKRSRVGNDGVGETIVATASSPATEVESEILDLARSMELKAGDRIEVQWEVDINGNNEEEEEEEEEGKGPSEEPTAVDESTPSHVHWWGATLLEHDGRTDDHVAIRTLLYDPYPDGGFPESSREDVIFMGPNVLLSYPSQDELNYRILTADGSEVSYIISNDQDIEELVDTILTNALQNTSSSFQQLDRSQQIRVAEQIATKKEKLIQLIKEHMMDDGGSHPNDLSTTGNPRNRTVTAQDALTLLARAMQSE